MKTETAKKTGIKSFLCEFCKKFYWTLDGLTSHKREFHNANGPHACPHCKKMLGTKKSLRNHILKHDKWNKKEEEKTIKEAKNTITFALKSEPNSCFQCNKSFKNLKVLKKHLLCHYEKKLSSDGHLSDRNMLRCDQCPRTFSSKGFLKNHLFYHTKPKRLIACSKCDKTYRYKENLKQHVKWHNGEKDYQCTECDKFFLKRGT
jgi:KRAB domain-containing zinc finger protein